MQAPGQRTEMSAGFTSPEAAEQAFYAAFARLDAAAMADVWAADQPVCCIHPGGALLQGRATVLQSWAEIFAGAQPPRLEWERLSAVSGSGLAVHVTAEHIETGAPAARSAHVVATNVFRRGPAGWTLIEHHASLPVMRRTRAERAPSLH